MSLGGTVYNLLFKRMSTFILTVAVGSFAFERGFDQITNYVWETKNKGKLWKDIKDKYEK